MSQPGGREKLGPERTHGWLESKKRPPQSEDEEEEEEEGEGEGKGEEEEEYTKGEGRNQTARGQESHF